MKKSLHYSSLEVQRDTQATFGVTFRVTGTFCHTQHPWTALSTLLWRESPGGLSRGFAPSLGQCSRAAGPGSALVSSPRAGAPGARRVPPRGAGTSPLTAAQAAPSGPGPPLPPLAYVV